MLPLLLLACATGAGSDPVDTSRGDGADTSSDDTSETSNGDTSGGDTSGGDTAPACVTVNSGDDWAWTGECPGMTTQVVVTVKGCAMALDYDAVGGMTMGMPYSATIDGDVVTFADDDTVDGCVGTVETADKITGSCDGGCTFRLKR